MAEVDLVVPTIPGRETSLERCVESYRAHADVHAIIVKDSETCGWGWRVGLEESTAPYVLLACDDQECVSGLETAIEAVDEGYIACPRVWMPGGTIESNGGDMDSYAHVVRRPRKDRSLVNYTTVPFVSREMIDRIGMLDIHYASDTWISYRGRQLGYESILRHGYEIVHHWEAVGRGAGAASMEDRDAMDCKVMYEELAKYEEVAA